MSAFLALFKKNNTVFSPSSIIQCHSKKPVFEGQDFPMNKFTEINPSIFSDPAYAYPPIYNISSVSLVDGAKGARRNG